MLHRGKRLLALFLAMATLAGAITLPMTAEGKSVKKTSASTVRKQQNANVGEEPQGETPAPAATIEATEEPAETEKPAESEIPQESETPKPTAAPTAIPTATPKEYILLNKDAKYYKGGQTGIHYNKVKGKKIYHITSYTTDSVKLQMTHKTTFKVYAGKTKKEVKSHAVKVSSSGVVKCKSHGSGEEYNTIIQAKSSLNQEVQYIYIHFKKKITCSNGGRVTLYEKYAETLHFDYARKNVEMSISNKKIATLSKTGRVTGVKHGTTYVTVKVKGSEKNQIRIKIVIRIEPWLVNAKDTKYDYNDMVSDIYSLRRKYSGKIAAFSIGSSEDKRTIWCLRIGNPNASEELVIDAGIHAREWKNTQIIMRQTEDILREYSDNRERFRSTCLYILPMVNPDGITIAQYGFDSIRNKKLQKRCKKIGHAATWKNNARGVNLNYNFPAGFSKKKKSKKPDAKTYPGKKAGSESETKALMKFLKAVEPDTVLNLHSTGSILYWDFNVTDSLHQKLYNLAYKVHSFNKYAMMPKSSSTNPSGGLADWLVYNRGITSITIETGTVVCPLPHSQFASIFKRNNEMFRWFVFKYKV